VVCVCGFGNQLSIKVFGIFASPSAKGVGTNVDLISVDPADANAWVERKPPTARDNGIYISAPHPIARQSKPGRKRGEGCCHCDRRHGVLL
jgi:hypothetical protein